MVSDRHVIQSEPIWCPHLRVLTLGPVVQALEFAAGRTPLCNERREAASALKGREEVWPPPPGMGPVGVPSVCPQLTGRPPVGSTLSESPFHPSLPLCSSSTHHHHPGGSWGLEPGTKWLCPLEGPAEGWGKAQGTGLPHSCRQFVAEWLPGVTEGSSPPHCPKPGPRSRVRCAPKTVSGTQKASAVYL